MKIPYNRNNLVIIMIKLNNAWIKKLSKIKFKNIIIIYKWKYKKTKKNGIKLNKIR